MGQVPVHFEDELEVAGERPLEAGHIRPAQAVFFLSMQDVATWVPGDEFVGFSKYLGITEKKLKDKPYRLLLTQTECVYYNQRGEKVCRAVGNVMLTCQQPGVKKGKGLTPEEIANYKLPHYSEDVLNEIYAQYEEELAGKLARGAMPRYWEDVNEGDEIPKLLKGPLDDSDMVAFVANEVNTGYPGAFAHKYALTFADPVYSIVSNETGARRSADNHINPVMAKQMGLPTALHYGAQSMAIISHAVTNWMGDDAFVRVMNMQCRRMTFMGDTNTTTGQVVKKYELGGRHLVDLKLGSATQDGVVHTTCDATVELLSRG